MAIFTPSVAVGGISGKVGGATFVNARGSKVIRPSGRPANSALTNAGELKGKAAGRFATLIRTWRTLTDAQRLSWVSRAQQTPRINRLGQSLPMTGYQLYLQQNGLLCPTTLPFLTSAPSGPAWLATEKPSYTFSSGQVIGADVDAQESISGSWTPAIYLGFTFREEYGHAPPLRFANIPFSSGSPASFSFLNLSPGLLPTTQSGMRLYSKIVVLPSTVRLASSPVHHSQLIP